MGGGRGQFILLKMMIKMMKMRMRMLLMMVMLKMMIVNDNKLGHIVKRICVIVFFGICEFVIFV